MWLNSDLWVTLLTFHGLMAFLLLGALTHQFIVVWAPVRSRVTNFFGRVRAVSAHDYGGAIVVLYVLTFVLGMIIYPDYKLTASVVMTTHKWAKALDSFEFKEHVLAIGLALLPAYWYYWRPPLVAERDFVRAMLTTMLAVIAWIGFLVGHILNNIAGLGIMPS
jgi:hypothetical protein